MPSEARLAQALAAVAAQREAYRAAVADAAAEIGTWLELRRAPPDGRATRARIELGPFASDRVDPALFATIFGTIAPLDPLSIARLESACEAMLRLIDAGNEPFALRVATGDDLRERIAAALADAGRAFASARKAELVRMRRNVCEELHWNPTGFPPALWNQAERQVAPPLVIDVDGGDLLAGGLGEFLVGAQKIVLLARGAAPPAPLVRLITPGVFVLQTTDASELDRISSIVGPAVAALLPEGCARFTHRPGSEPLRDRLQVDVLPPRPRGSVGKVSLFQQVEELEQLRLLVVPGAEQTLPPKEAATSPPPPAASDPAGRLAAWLLSQAGLNGGADREA